MPSTVYHFGAGPAKLPTAVLKEAQAELMSWQGLGYSVLEAGHRNAPFQQLLNEATADLIELLAIPAGYHVLFLGGAARAQFAAIPLNLLSAEQQGAYLVSGVWSAMAYQEALNVATAYCLASSEAKAFQVLPDSDSLIIKPNTAYVYYTPNETINGVQFKHVPLFSDVPLIADMTSCLLTEPINVADYGLIFAGGQKNFSAAGLTVVIVHQTLLDKVPEMILPTMMDYRVHAAHHSLYATPPVFNCYLAAKVFKWMKAQGGVHAFYQMNQQKAALLYQYIDDSSFYQTKVDKQARSIINVCFHLSQPHLEKKFIDDAASQGLLFLAGHRLAGGLRASLYNAMPIEGVEALIHFMHTFARAHQA